MPNRRGKTAPRVPVTRGGWTGEKRDLPFQSHRVAEILGQPIDEETLTQIRDVWDDYCKCIEDFEAPLANADPNEPKSYGAQRKKIEEQLDSLLDDMPGKGVELAIIRAISACGSQALPMGQRGETAFEANIKEAEYFLSVALFIVRNAENVATFLPNSSADSRREAVVRLWGVLKTAGLDPSLSPTTIPHESGRANWDELTPFEVLVREFGLASSGSPAACAKWIRAAIPKTG